ncbi:hypothetical protein DNTS_012279, partial [Danionella cerebrum]
ILSVPHRRLVCCSRLYEVTDVNKAQKQASHQREVFLFNDLIVILKLCPKKKSTATYTFCKAMGLLGMQFHLFENEYFPHGITILSPFSSEKKQVVSFCSQSADELLRFVEDLRESIAEVAEMEQIRIEWELERQQGVRNQTSKNGAQLDLHGGHSSAAGDDFYEKTGSNTVEVCISAWRCVGLRLCVLVSVVSPECVSPDSVKKCFMLSGVLDKMLQTYQLSSPLAPPIAQQQHLAVLPSPVPSISPETLIQCQQIVKVIVVDAAGRGHVEAFLSQNPAHRLIQSAVSTPTRSRDGSKQQQQQRPPLPPPPPPYHHPHQFCPPTPPPPPRHLLSQRRYSSGTRSLV